MKKLRIATSLAAVLLLPVVVPASTVASAPAPEARGVLRSKSSLGVGVSYTLGATAVGTPSTLTIVTTSKAEAATITVRPDAALALASTDLAVDSAQPLGASNTFTLKVTPSSEGLHYVNVFVRSGTRARALAIPVQVGAVGTSSAREGKLQVSPGGQRVISIPAKP